MAFQTLSMAIDMQSIKSNTYTVQADVETLFTLLSDTNNMQQLMPDKVKNWQSDTNSCAFDIEGLASLQMQKKDSQAHSKISWESVGKNPFPFQLLHHIHKIDEQQSEISFDLEADMNPMLAMMAKKPLKNLLNHFCSSLQQRYK